MLYLHTSYILFFKKKSVRPFKKVNWLVLTVGRLGCVLYALLRNKGIMTSPPEITMTMMRRQASNQTKHKIQKLTMHMNKETEQKTNKRNKEKAAPRKLGKELNST